MSEWSITKLGDVLEITNGYAFKSVNFRSEPEAGCLPVLKIKNVANGDVHINDVQYHHFEEKLSKYTAQKGDILISLTGNHPHAETQVVGAVSKLKMDIRAFVNQRVAKIDTKPNLADKDYIYFALKEEGLSKYLASQSSGSANQANISKADIEDLDIALPPLPEQKTIASVLSSLDDKIDLLHRQNKTLEAMAETLFRQWFIEEAKEDWEDKQLGTLLTVKRGGSPRPIQDYLSDSGYCWLKISDVTSLNSPFVFNIKEHIKEEGLSKTTLLQAGKLVLSNSATPAIPKILMVDTCIHDGWLHFPVSTYSNEYLYLLFNHIRPELLQLGNGSIFTNLKTDILKEYVVKHPDETTLLKFQTVVEPIFTKLLKNAKQIQTLEKLRDTLLPKLMSGEVRVEYQTKEVA